MQYSSDPARSKTYFLALGKPETDCRIWKNIGSTGNEWTEGFGSHFFDFENGAVTLEFAEADNGESYCSSIWFSFDNQSNEEKFGGEFAFGLAHNICPATLSKTFGKEVSFHHHPESKLLVEENMYDDSDKVYQTIPEMDVYCYRISGALVMTGRFSKGSLLDLEVEIEHFDQRIYGWGPQLTISRKRINRLLMLFRQPPRPGPSFIPSPDYNPFSGSKFASYGIFSELT